MKRKILLLCFVIAISIPLMAHWQTHGSPFGGTAAPPTIPFHSTSAMIAVNSSYSANPYINEDGIPQMVDGTQDSSEPSHTAAHAPAIRRAGAIGEPEPDDDFLPVGDALIPLLLLLLVYVSIKKVRKTHFFLHTCKLFCIFAAFLEKEQQLTFIYHENTSDYAAVGCKASR